MYKTKLFPALLLFALIGNFLTFNLVCAQGVMPIHVHLKQSESEHFIYIYEKSLQNQIPGIIKDCEDAHSILSPTFNWVPKNKTIVMYSDAQDVHNGWATVYPRPMIMIYASDAPPGSTIYEPGNYIRRTIFHEYAHILSMDAQYGTDDILTDVFGRINILTGDYLSFVLMLLAAPPGVLAPAWYKEGLAIWAETEFVGPGRGRSTRMDMIMRMAMADKRVLSGKKWFPDLPEWPYGNAAYLYGLKTIEYIHDVYGFQDQEKNAPGEVSDSVSHSFMFIFNKRTLPLTGKTFTQLADEAMQAELSRQAKRIEKLKKRTFTGIRRLTPKRIIVTKPKFGPDGRSIYFSGKEEADHNTLFRYDRSSKNLSKLTSISTTMPLFTDLAPTLDRKSIYYTRLDIHGRDRIRNELYRLNTQNDRSQIIAKTGRYRYLAISPNGLHMAAVVTRAGKQSLVEVPITKAGEKKFEKTMIKAPQYHTLVDPNYTPDGRYIVYIQADEKASSLRRVNLRTRKDEELLKWPCIILSPVFHPFERSLIFVSDKNGVYNLYRMPFDPHAEPLALTHVLGGIFNPDFSSDGKFLAATAYDSYGYYLTVLDYEKIRPISGALPTIEDDWKSLHSNKARKEKVEHTPTPEIVRSRDYNSFSNIEFDFWSPWLTASGNDFMGGVFASFSDPTQFQNLYLLAGTESNYNTPIGLLIYQYSGIYPVFTLYGASRNEFYTDLIKDINMIYYDYDEEVHFAGISMSLPWLRIDWQGDLTLGYKITDRSVIEESAALYKNKNLTTTHLFEGTESTLWSQVDFSNAKAFGRSNSLEDGRYLTATIEWSDESLGSDINRTRMRGDWHEYINLPWFENHILKIEGVYAAGKGDKTAQGLFGLGGFPSALIPIPGLDRNVSLRGYRANYQVGDEIVKGSIAYRFPIYWLYKNINTTSPFYLHQLFGEFFYEGGKATGEEVTEQKNEWINSAGLEINLSTTLFRSLQISPGIGIVYAFDLEDRKRADNNDNDDDKLQVYISIKGTVNF